MIECDTKYINGRSATSLITQNDHVSMPFIMSSIKTQSGPTASTPVSGNSTGLPPSGHRPRSGSAREQAVHAVDYYNSNVLRARVGAGLSGARSSVNERHLNSSNNRNGPASVTSSAQKTNSRIYLNPDNLYRSNSSLELLHDHSSSTNESLALNGGNLRREYGSHGSIDVISSPSSATTSESFFAMLQDYRPAVLGLIGTDQRSPGPAEFLKGKVSESARKVNGAPNVVSNQSNSEENYQGDRASSPKLRAKFQRLWAPNGADNRRQTNRTQTILIDDCTGPPISINNPLTVGQPPNTSLSISSHTQAMSSPDIEERQRRRAFAHFDCQSLTANLGYAAKLRGLLLARRRNTTTGASAASMMSTRSSTPDAESGDEDFGDGQNNDLLENCPFFRNEIGNEEEREVCLTRAALNKIAGQKKAVHRPALACGVSVLECPINETLWKQTTCPFQKGTRPIESVDHGARYYRQYFQAQEHQNWFGMDEQLGPIAISIKREKLPELNDTNHGSRHQFRMIVRTSELLTLRGSVLEDSIPNTRGQGKAVTTKEVLEYVAPEVQLNCLRLGVTSPQCEQQLIKLDEQGLTNKYKIGILYCRAGQSSEEDMYNNEEAGPAFTEFLDTVGKRVRLKGFDHYKAGLDNKTDSTGTHSLYATFQDCEIMFHVSTMLPFTPNNRQQLLRKRHIGNDIVTIVFQEPGALPFTPKSIRSQFQHVFIVVRVVNPCSENTYYRVAVSRSKEVPVFGPPLTPGAKFSRGKSFADFLLAKVINAENAAHRSEKFATMATRTRQEYLKDLAANYCTTAVVDTGPKFSIFPSKKKEKPKPRFSGDASQRGAFCWQVVLQDSGQSTTVDCFLGISTETFVLIEECSRQIVFVTPCKSILGWSTNGNSLRIYHHQGECVTLNMRDSGERDEQLEVIERLRSVTVGCGALELNLRRNPMGQLGFHVQPDGVVTQVETSGQAWAAGLRQGFRLVEICKVAVATLTHDQMVDLLKTSAQVTVTVIESFADYSPRRGCFLPNCRFNNFAYDSDYETSDSSKNSKKSSTNAQLQQPVVNQRRRYERNFSPPRSSNSSGYGTGSSSRSFSIPNEQARQTVDMGTLTSSSSGHSSNDDRWYDILENVIDLQCTNSQPLHHHHGHHNHNDHHKLSASASLPVNHNGNPRPLSIHDPTKLSTAISEHIAKTSNVESLIAKHNSKTSADSNDSNLMINEPIYNKSVHSTDDELQNEISPNLKRSATTTNIPKVISANSGNISSSSSSSRNNSPRPLSEALTATAAAKLRPGVTPRNQTFLLQRNSTTGNTLQEDLMKLINPDSDEMMVNCNGMKSQKSVTNSHSVGNIPGLKNDETPMKKISRSREGINMNQQNASASESKKNEPSDGGEKPEVIYTTARPATVISQNNKDMSKTTNENLLFIAEPGRYQQNGGVNNTPKKFDNQITSQPLPLLPDPNDMDWSSLVDTATKAMMMQFTEEHSKQHSLSTENMSLNLQHNSLDLHQQHEPHSLNIQSSTGASSQYPLTPSNSLPELQNHLSQLEDRILRETRRRKSLEHAVRRLTEENRRLQDESQAAVQQLRRFTEWFFQTIDRQS